MTRAPGFVRQETARADEARRRGGLVMVMTGTKPVVREDEDIGTGGGEGHTVFLFNCECHTFEEVIAQLCKAVPGMTEPEAEEIAWRVHTQGLAEVYKGSQGECDRVAKIISEIGLIVQVH